MYRIREGRREEYPFIYRLIHSVWHQIGDNEIFVVGNESEEEFCAFLAEHGFALVAEYEEDKEQEGYEEKTLAGVLVIYILGVDEDNYGYKLGMTGDSLMRTANIDTAAVLPEHRGNRLEKQLFFAAEPILRAKGICNLICTISPDNLPSLKNAVNTGYRIIRTQEMYGGRKRHILLKEIALS
ncbi:MAG: hypothetical protein IKN57_14565 [Parasporobacterium sp.]|nr:hypothetical protein [Parasporobacterium sp.]